MHKFSHQSLGHIRATLGFFTDFIPTKRASVIRCYQVCKHATRMKLVPAFQDSFIGIFYKFHANRALFHRLFIHEKYFAFRVIRHFFYNGFHFDCHSYSKGCHTSFILSQSSFNFVSWRDLNKIKIKIVLFFQLSDPFLFYLNLSS